jgi:hypothetical protein
MTGLFRVVRPVIGLLTFALFTNGCDQPFRSTPIHDLLASPGQYDGKTVKVSGEVTNVVKLPFVSARFYTIKDATGEIPVVTYGQVPAAQSTTTVSGVFSTVAIAGVEAVGAHITVGSANAK